MSRATDWIKSIRGKFSATPGTAVVGFDQAAAIKRSAQYIWDSAEAGKKRLQEADARWKYDTRESYVCLARRLSDDRVSKRAYYEVRTMTDVPGCRGEQAFGRDWTIEGAETELRFRLAQLYLRHSVVRDPNEARERAAKVELMTERSFAMGSR